MREAAGRRQPGDRAFADVWSSLGGELKPSLDLVVTAPAARGFSYPVGPPVTAGVQAQFSAPALGINESPGHAAAGAESLSGAGSAED